MPIQKHPSFTMAFLDCAFGHDNKPSRTKEAAFETAAEGDLDVFRRHPEQHPKNSKIDQGIRENGWEYIPSWELTYPYTKARLKMMIFLFPRWVPCDRSVEGNHFQKEIRDSSFEKKSWWWFAIHFIFTPILGEMIQFDEHIFQMGWFNHQLEIQTSPTPSIYLCHPTTLLAWWPSDLAVLLKGSHYTGKDDGLGWQIFSPKFPNKSWFWILE